MPDTAQTKKISGGILLTGGAGFIGSHVLERIEAVAPQLPLRLMVHSRIPETFRVPSASITRADLASPATLAASCEGVETLIHCATYVGDDAARCERVNGAGTVALVSAAIAAGVNRIVYISNAAVYGSAPHSGSTESQTVRAPASPAASSLMVAETAVIAAGGVVLRPLFVYGNGDKRFIPSMLSVLRKTPFLISGARARVSVISAAELASIIVSIALRPQRLDAGAYHVTDGHPVSVRQIARVFERYFELQIPRIDLPYLVARPILPLVCASRRSWSESISQQLSLISRDHFYSDSQLRTKLGLHRTLRFDERFPDYLEWYDRFAARPPARPGARPQVPGPARQASPVLNG